MARVRAFVMDTACLASVNAGDGALSGGRGDGRGRGRDRGRLVPGSGSGLLVLEGVEQGVELGVEAIEVGLDGGGGLIASGGRGRRGSSRVSRGTFRGAGGVEGELIPSQVTVRLSRCCGKARRAGCARGPSG